MTKNSATNESSRCRPQLTAELRDSTTRDAREFFKMTHYGYSRARRSWSDKNYRLLVLKNLLPAAVLAKQAGNWGIGFHHYRANSMVAQRFTPVGLPVVHGEKLFYPGVAVNIGATVNVDPVIRVKSPNQIAAPHVLVVDRLGWFLRQNEVHRRRGKLLRFAFMLLCDGMSHTQSNNTYRGNHQQSNVQRNLERSFRAHLALLRRR